MSYYDERIEREQGYEPVRFVDQDVEDPLGMACLDILDAESLADWYLFTKHLIEVDDPYT